MLVVAKTRVGPLKTRTIPELELCGATLLAELLVTTRTTLNIPPEQVTAWCDSTIVLCWLNNCPSRYKTFVGNRNTTVTSCFSPSVWHHVPSEEKPADCASRGLSARELREHKLWWSGPPWLLMEPIGVPRQPQKSELDQLQTEGAKASTCLAVSSEPAVWLAHRYSSYRTLTHVTAWVLRAAYNFLAPIKLHPLNKDSHVTVDEIKSALNFLQKSSQKRTFPSEIKQLTTSPPQTLSSTSQILSLNPFMGKDGLLHIGGRLSKAPIPFSEKYPVMLSAKDILTQLIFIHRHLTLSHCGPTLLFSTVGADYFITGAKQLARKICRSCVVCQTKAATVERQLMGQLPKTRVSESTAFNTTGVDFAGPFTLKRGYTRKPQLVKGYLAVFVCFSTRAVHLEIVSDLTTEAFLAAMKRFVGRRRLPLHVYSDNGSNFIGAEGPRGALPDPVLH